MIIVVILAVFALIYFGLPKIVSRFSGNQIEETGEYSYNYNSSADIVVNGTGYNYNSRITTTLILGIDKDGKVAEAKDYTDGGQADAIYLVVADDKEKTVNVIQLNRDTMAQIRIIDKEGNKIDKVNGQLALAHSYGDGLKKSCQNTVYCVETLMYNIKIDNYIALNMDSIKVITDLVKGVKVTLDEDYLQFDPSFKKGSTVTLNADQAYNFVRNRRNVSDGTNVSRMQRQRLFIDAMVDSLISATKADSKFAETAYKSISDYMVSSMNEAGLLSYCNRISGYTRNEIVTPEGKNDTDDTYAKFTIDDEALYNLVLKTFYVIAEEA